MFGLYRYAKNKIKKSLTPDVKDIFCPNCSTQMFSKKLRYKCGTEVDLP